MFGFYQFKDDKYYNKPVAESKLGLSIFPYHGANTYTPYRIPIPITKGRYSKSALDGNNSEITSFDTAHQHARGPLPYIYKLDLAGFTSNYSCNTCAALNNRTFYLYQTTSILQGGMNGPGLKATWVGTICNDSYPDGIYIRTPDSYFLEIPFSTPIEVKLPGDNLYDLIILTLHESVDTSIDKSWLVVTLGSSLESGMIAEGNSYAVPFLLYKEFAAGERIFALEESVALTPTTLINMDGTFIGTHTSANVCNSTSVTATLTPYQTSQFDIYNNNNHYANLDNFGLTHDKHPYTTIVTSSGNLNIDKYHKTAAIKTLHAPPGFQLTLSNVSTDNQGNHVPCDTYFNRSFQLKGWYGTLFTFFNNEDILLNKTQKDTLYVWDNGNARSQISETQRNYLTLGAYRGTEPHLDNISLAIAGTGGYLEISFWENAEQNENRLVYRHPYSTMQSLLSTTFNSWTLESDTSTLRSYCNFDGVSISLEPLTSNFQQGRKQLSCVPLCSDNTYPTSLNISIRISGYVQTTDGRYQYDKTMNILSDLKTDFFISIYGSSPENNDIDTLFSPYELLNPNLENGEFTYWCGDNGEDETYVYMAGSVEFPTETINAVRGGSPCVFEFDGFSLGQSQNLNYTNNTSVSGCRTTHDCSLGIPFGGAISSFINQNFTCGLGSSVNLHCSGIATFV